MRLSSFTLRGLGVAAAFALAIATVRDAGAAGPFGLNGPVPANSELARASAARGFDLSALDPTCPACKDFAQFATGGWKSNNPIPADRTNWARFIKLQQENQDVVHGILEKSATANAAAGSNERKVGDFYRSCMDTAARDAAGITPIRPFLDRAGALNAASDLPATLAYLHDNGIGALFTAGPSGDARDSNATILGVGQGGLGLGDRDFYLKPESAALRDAYLTHVTNDLVLSGESPAAAAADAASVLAFETKLAEMQRDRVAMRNPDLTYHKGDLAALNTTAPAFAWGPYFAARHLPAATTPINVSNPEYAAKATALAAATPVDVLRAYLRSHVISAYASALSTAFVNEQFAFDSKTSGLKQRPPLSQTCTAATDAVLGEAVGEQYVAQRFSPQARERARTMIANLQSVLRDDIGQLDWMSPATKAEAITKLNAFTVKVGYPDKWQDYTALTVVPGPFAQNAINARIFGRNRAADQIGKPRDRARWNMTPPTVNAYYSPNNNEIVFPAGILQPPFFDPSNDDAINYGGMGAVIGHEMTHGFDNTGRKFDAQGNNRDWWTPADATAYEARAKCVADEFSSFKVGDLPINGPFVLGEAIADLGGITIAYKAFEKSQAGKPRTIIDGFTPEQRFFLGYAQWFTRSFRDEEAKRRITTDPHPNDEYRINGTVANLPEFAKAFFCTTNDPMVRPAAQRCKIW